MRWPDPPQTSATADRDRRVAAALEAVDPTVAAADLAEQVARLTEERDAALADAAAARESVEDLRSAAKGAVTIPRGLLSVRRGRRTEAGEAEPDAEAATAPRPAPAPKPTPTPAPTSPAADPRALHHAFDAYVPTPRDRPVIALIATDEVAAMLATVATVVRLRTEAPHLVLPRIGADVLVVCASAGRAGSWTGLGAGTAAARDDALDHVLRTATAARLPALLVADCAAPGLAARASSFTATVGGGGDGGWEWGVAPALDGPIGPAIGSSLVEASDERHELAADRARTAAILRGADVVAVPRGATTWRQRALVAGRPVLDLDGDVSRALASGAQPRSLLTRTGAQLRDELRTIVGAHTIGAALDRLLDAAGIGARTPHRPVDVVGGMLRGEFRTIDHPRQARPGALVLLNDPRLADPAVLDDVLLAARLAPAVRVGVVPPHDPFTVTNDATDAVAMDSELAVLGMSLRGVATLTVPGPRS